MRIVHLKTAYHSNRRHSARGFTLIEVLVALVVLALGLLGLALLQTTSLRYAQSANYRTQATNLAYDLLDQIRANRALVSQYTSINAGTFSSVTGQNCTRPVNFVTPANNITRWTCQVRATLGPGATAVVTQPSAGVVNVVVNWSDVRGAVGASANNSYGQVEVETQL